MKTKSVMLVLLVVIAIIMIILGVKANMKSPIYLVELLKNKKDEKRKSFNYIVEAFN